MKKLTSVTLALCLLLSLFAFAANAADSITVTVTIADKTGKLVLAAEPVTVTDVDNDKAFTVHDTLTCAHEQYYGSKDGYQAEASLLYDGLSLVKLWGETNNYSVGYYCNDKSCWSLLDQVKQGDRVTAFAYKDAEKYSDVYTFCTPSSAAVKTGETLKLTVKKLQYDLLFNLIEIPAAGARITVDGKATDYVVNDKGEVEILILKPGKHVVSVTSDKEILVPFAAKVQVSFNLISFAQWLYQTVVNWFTGLINR